MPSMSSSREHPALVTLQTMFKKITDVPYCTGTVPLNAEQSLLFYRSKNESRFVDFANPTKGQLKNLANSCSPATFGRNQEDILDENYRKAGKMDTSAFSVQFSPWDSGIIHTLVDNLFKSSGTVANVTVELYKLNVYGTGSFFKAHVDTPRSDKMFGSLVVVLPTPHSGGSLLFRLHDMKYKFDSATMVASASTANAPHVAFAAFFSDVEHEVAEVTSGYRVTLTYNLYHKNPSPSDNIIIQNDGEIELAMQQTLTSLLSVPGFLQDGGLLAFALSHEYPINPHSTRLSDIANQLKGVDVILKRVCDQLKLDASVKALYRNEREDGLYCFVDTFIQFGSYYVDDGLWVHLCRYEKGQVVYDAFSGIDQPDIEDYDLDGDVKVSGVVWAKPLDDRNSFEEQYIAYGNEASLSCAYGKVCLVVRIKPASERD